MPNFTEGQNFPATVFHESLPEPSKPNQPNMYSCLGAFGSSKLVSAVLTQLLQMDEPNSQEDWGSVLEIMKIHSHQHEKLCICHRACALQFPDSYGFLATACLATAQRAQEENSFNLFSQHLVLSVLDAGTCIQNEYKKLIWKDSHEPLTQFITSTFGSRGGSSQWESEVLEQARHATRLYFCPANPLLRQQVKQACLRDILPTCQTVLIGLETKLELSIRYKHSSLVGPGFKLFTEILSVILNPDHMSALQVLNLATQALNA